MEWLAQPGRLRSTPRKETHRGGGGSRRRGDSCIDWIELVLQVVLAGLGVAALAGGAQDKRSLLTGQVHTGGWLRRDETPDGELEGRNEPERRERKPGTFPWRRIGWSRS